MHPAKNYYICSDLWYWNYYVYWNYSLNILLTRKELLFLVRPVVLGLLGMCQLFTKHIANQQEIILIDMASSVEIC